MELAQQSAIIKVQSKSRTHVKDTVSSGDREDDGQQPDSKRDARISPATLPGNYGFEDKVAGAPLGEDSQSDKSRDEEDDVEDSADGFEGVQERSEIEVEDERDDDKGPHNKCNVP